MKDLDKVETKETENKPVETKDADLVTLDLDNIDTNKEKKNNAVVAWVKAHKGISIAIAAVVVLAVIILAIVIVKANSKPQPKPVATVTPTSTPEPSSEPAVTPEPVEIPIDFAAYQAQNPDVYAWIQIPDTNINYPILQHPTDNYYYLNHTITGEEKTEGSIYTETYNTKTFEDSNTIIYGHNMRNGSMFKHVHKFKDLDFFNSHRTMYIYTPTQILEYRIFATYTTDSRHLHYTYNFADESVYATYLTEIFNGRSSLMQGGNLDTSINLNSSNKIVTLQTCTGNDNTRLLLQAVLVKVSGTPNIVVPNTICTTGAAVKK